ncbi:MAG: hypothetical protein ACXQT4_05560 [Methanotrichaceae archaeon]
MARLYPFVVLCLLFLHGAVAVDTNFSAGNDTCDQMHNQSLNFSLHATNFSANSSQMPEFFDVGQIPFGIFGAHFGWISRDPQANEMGRHTEYGRRTADLAGIFSIDMTIKLESNQTTDTEDADWLS